MHDIAIIIKESSKKRKWADAEVDQVEAVGKELDAIIVK
jgi:hypothetical protein